MFLLGFALGQLLNLIGTILIPWVLLISEQPHPVFLGLITTPVPILRIGGATGQAL